MTLSTTATEAAARAPSTTGNPASRGEEGAQATPWDPVQRDARPTLPPASPAVFLPPPGI